MSLVVFFTSDFENRSAGLRLKKLTDWIVQWWPDVSALQIANWVHIANHHIIQYIVLFDLETRML